MARRARRQISHKLATTTNFHHSKKNDLSNIYLLLTKSEKGMYFPFWFYFVRNFSESSVFPARFSRALSSPELRADDNVFVFLTAFIVRMGVDGGRARVLVTTLVCIELADLGKLCAGCLAHLTFVCDLVCEAIVVFELSAPKVLSLRDNSTLTCGPSRDDTMEKRFNEFNGMNKWEC